LENNKTALLNKKNSKGQMKELKERIVNDGKIINKNILKVDSFLNHQIDPILTQQAALEIVDRFKDDKIDKILTIESSGIAVAMMIGLELGVNIVFAKKNKPSTMESNYTSRVKSFTKNTHHDVVVSSDYIKKDERILVVDDFLAGGHAAQGMIELIRQAKATLVGVAIMIEKGFLDGGKELRSQGIKLESLAIIDSLENNTITFREE
jgi:xanthine phosphoribosyltransferase